MKQQNFLERLQNLHPSHKGRILLAAAILSTLGVGSLWVNTVQEKFSIVDTNDIAFLDQGGGAVLSATNYVTVESTEVKNNLRYIYFKVENNTDNILNFSSSDKITLELDGQATPIRDITDRQNSKFPVKILSKTVAYGSIVIENTTAQAGTIVFDNIYFETTPDNLSRETIELDFTELKGVEELRS